MHDASCSLRFGNAGLVAAARMEVELAEDLRRASSKRIRPVEKALLLSTSTNGAVPPTPLDDTFYAIAAGS
jgi:hypothetical protein